MGTHLGVLWDYVRSISKQKVAQSVYPGFSTRIGMLRTGKVCAEVESGLIWTFKADDSHLTVNVSRWTSRLPRMIQYMQMSNVHSCTVVRHSKRHAKIETIEAKNATQTDALCWILEWSSDYRPITPLLCSIVPAKGRLDGCITSHIPVQRDSPKLNSHPFSLETLDFFQ